MYISIPFNLKFLLFCISIFIYKSPLFPPFAPSLPWPISLIFSPFFIPFGIFIENTLLLPFTSFNAIFFSVPKYASSRLTFISVSMSFPRIGSCSFIFSGSFSTFPKNNEKVINYLKDKESVLKYLTENVVSGDVIIFKASNGMKFFELCNQFEEKIKKL